MSNLDLRHPERDFLLPYLDGELPPRKARQVRRHVEACWQCRAELEELKVVVADCVRYRKHWQEASLAQPPEPWRDLSREFARIDAARERRPAFSRPFIRWISLTASCAVVVAATLTLRILERPRSEEITQPQTQAPTANLIPESAPLPASTQAVPAGAPAAPVQVPRHPVVLQASVADELQAVVALHRLGADLGDPVEVARVGERVVVRGAGVSAVRERELRDALVSLPNVQLEFPGPAAVSTGLGPAPASTVAQSPSLPSALQNRLEAELGGHTQFEGFSARLLDQQDATMARIYALRRLALEFTPEAEAQLSAADQRLLRNLAHEHLQVMVRQIAEIHRIAEPVLAPMLTAPRAPSAQAPAVPSPPQAGATWQAMAEDIFSSGRHIDSLLATLLGASSAEPEQTGTLPDTFVVALARLQLSMQQCELLLTH